MSDTQAVVADVVAAAERTGAPIDTVVHALRLKLDLGSLPISVALGVDATSWIRDGVRYGPDIADNVNQLWSEVVPTGAQQIPADDPDRSWTGAALCRNQNPAIWFCDDEACDYEIMAVTTCVKCPVVGNCALDSIGENDGIWGGLTRHARTRLKRFIQLGVADATPDGIRELVVSMAEATMSARVAHSLDTPESGALFEFGPGTPVVVKRTRTNRGRVAQEPLFSW